MINMNATVFASPEEREVFQKFIEIIIAKDFSLWDECLNEIRLELAERADAKFLIPASALLLAEDKHHLTKLENKSRYQARVTEEE